MNIGVTRGREISNLATIHISSGLRITSEIILGRKQEKKLVDLNVFL